MKCPKCDGEGFIEIQVCCGEPVVGAEYMGAQEMICCGDANTDTEDCPMCKGSGEVKDPVTESTSQEQP